MSKLDSSDISSLPWYNDKFGKYFIFTRIITYTLGQK